MFTSHHGSATFDEFCKIAAMMFVGIVALGWLAGTFGWL